MTDREEINDLINESKEYLDARVDLMKMQIAEQSSEAFARLMGAFIIAGVLLLFLISLSFFLGMALSTLWGNYVLGFGAVSAFYLVIFLVMIFKRDKILRIPIQNQAIRLFFKDETEDSH